MPGEMQILALTAAALVVAGLVSFITTPLVKTFAQKVGAVDVPKDDRRMHSHPIPRMGGLAIFLGFLFSVLIFAELTAPVKSMLLGGVIIVVLGIFDDIYALGAKFKFVVQILAALVAIFGGSRIEVISIPIFSATTPTGSWVCSPSPSPSSGSWR